MELLGGLIALAGLVVLVVGIIGLIKPANIRMASRNQTAAITMGGVILMTIGGSILPDDPKKAGAQEVEPAKSTASDKPSLKEASPMITEVKASGTQLNVHLFIDTAWDDVWYVNSVAQKIGLIAEQLKKGAAEDGPAIQTVAIEVDVAGTDKLGNETELSFMRAEFSAADLRAANIKNLTFARTLNLATEVAPSSGAGMSAIAKWCEKNLEAAPDFCSKALL